MILFTKKTEANAAVAELFSGRKAQKVYQAHYRQAARKPGFRDEFEVKNYLGKAKGTGKKAIFTEVHSGGDFAHTSFKVAGAVFSGTLGAGACPIRGALIRSVFTWPRAECRLRETPLTAGTDRSRRG